MRALVIDTIAPEGIAYLEERGFHVDQISSTLPEHQLYERVADYEAIVTRSSTAVTAEFLAHARKLRILWPAGGGRHHHELYRLLPPGRRGAHRPVRQVRPAAGHTRGLLLGLGRR